MPAAPAKKAVKKVVKKAAPKKAVKKAAPKKKSWEELDADELRALIIKKTLEYPSGCASGKHDFIKTLGAKLPETNITFTVTIKGANANMNDVTAAQIENTMFFDEWYVGGRYVDLVPEEATVRISDLKVEQS